MQTQQLLQGPRQLQDETLQQHEQDHLQARPEQGSVSMDGMSTAQEARTNAARTTSTCVEAGVSSGGNGVKQEVQTTSTSTELDKDGEDMKMKHGEDLYLAVVKQFHQEDLLSGSPILKALSQNSGHDLEMESKKWCIEVLLAFRKYRDGDETDRGNVKHSFQYVIDVVTSAMKCIVSHLSKALDPRGPCLTFAILDGVTTGVVVNTWRPSETVDSDSRHLWCKRTCKAYRAIIEQLEKYWVLTLVYTSGASVPAQVSWAAALDVISARLSHLSAMAALEICPESSEQEAPDNNEHLPLAHAVMVCKRDWNAPIVLSVLKGMCEDVNHREAAMLQKARLHVLERCV